MLARVLLALAVCVPTSGGAQAAPATAATTPGYITRGREVEAKQRAFGDRVARLHAAITDTLKRWAPDLLPRLEPPPPIATGYQLLPRITPSGAKQPVTALAPLVSYSWQWSETLMDRETAALARIEVDLLASSGRRSALDSLVTAYRGLSDRKRLVDADVNYNWLWQTTITGARAVFDKNTRLQEAILRQRSAQNPSTRAADSAMVATGLATDVHRVDAPAYLKFEHRGAEWIVTVPVATDVDDSMFVKEFARLIAENWRARSASGVEYRVVAAIQMISPTVLYCGAGVAPGCAPPARGAAINMAAHLAKFPANVAILTSGAGSTHFEGGRAIVFSPHDAPGYLIAHEFGHVLGFQDAYIRGYRDVGHEGFVVTELVVDNTDVMGNSKDGFVKASHFERLLGAREVPALMKAGLAAFYERGDAREAVLKFQDVLRRQPTHYGAGFQLAKALDALGQPAEAAAQWQKVLAAALTIGDSATARQVRERLARP